MHGGDHGGLGDACNPGSDDRRAGGHPHRMAIEASFAKELTGPEDADDRFLPLLGNDGELDLALLDVKDRVRGVTLRKNDFILLEFGYRFSLAHLGKKFPWIKRSPGFSPQNAHGCSPKRPLSDEG